MIESWIASTECLPVRQGGGWVGMERIRCTLEQVGLRTWFRLLDILCKSRHPTGGFGWVDGQGGILLDYPIEGNLAMDFLHLIPFIPVR